jgi:hypothetical protein
MIGERVETAKPHAERSEAMLMIKLSEGDIMRLKVVIMDQDRDDAYAFLRDRLMPEIEKQEDKSMKSHLEGGKGSMF